MEILSNHPLFQIASPTHTQFPNAAFLPTALLDDRTGSTSAADRHSASIPVFVRRWTSRLAVSISPLQFYREASDRRRPSDPNNTLSKPSPSITVSHPLSFSAYWFPHRDIVDLWVWWVTIVLLVRILVLGKGAVILHSTDFDSWLTIFECSLFVLEDRVYFRSDL